MSDLEEKDTKRNVPKLRFPGFTDPWEQRKVRELLNERNERAPKSDEYPLMAFIANEGVAPKGERFDRSALINDTEGKLYKRTKYNDFIYSSNNLETGSIGLNKYGNACISPVYSIFETSDIADPDFIGRRFTCKDFIYKMVKSRQGVIYGQWRIHESDFLKIDIEVPGKVEQKAIGYFFNYFDNLITLRQRELDHVKLMKRGLLQKMFPKDGADTPEIRFPGFADPWEQRKFSDLTDRVSIQSSDPDLPQVEYEDIISGEGTLNKDLRDKEGGKTGIKFYAGDVLYGKLRPYLMNWLYPQFNGVAVGDFWVLRATECDSSFLYRLIQTDSFQRLANVSSGSKMPRADWNLISQSFFAVPVDHAEQKVIAKSLAELDSLITLRQRELDHVKLLKKSLLQQMFV